MSIMHPKIYKMNFNQLFKQIDPEEITDNVFTLVGKDYLVKLSKKQAITANLYLEKLHMFGYTCKKITMVDY